MADWGTDIDIDELGPIDYAVVEFPAGRSTFTGELAMELAALVDAGVIRLLDLVVVRKSEAGVISTFEIDELDHADEVQGLTGELAEILAEQDVLDLAAAMDPGSAAGLLVWENTWAAPFASAARRSGGQLIAGGRITVEALAASIAADVDAGGR